MALLSLQALRVGPQEKILSFKTPFDHRTYLTLSHIRGSIVMQLVLKKSVSELLHFPVLKIGLSG